MRIGILTTHTEKEEDQRLLQAANEKGYTARTLHALKCSISICKDIPEVYYDGRAISKDFDIIIPRIDTPHTEYGFTILKQFESMHVFTSELARGLMLGRDKLQCMQRLLKKDVPFPTTGYAYSKEDFENVIHIAGGVPLVIKLVEGTEGVGVFLADDMKHAVNLLKTFKQLSTPLIVQKFIEESSGTDLRVFVIGGKIAAAMERTSKDGDFRANISLGGQSKNVDLTPEEKDAAIRASEAVGVNVAGVDLVQSNNGPLVLEINTSPDFGGEWGLENITNVDIAGAIVDHAVESYEAAQQEKASA